MKFDKQLQDSDPVALKIDILEMLSLSGQNVCEESLEIIKLTGGTSNNIYRVNISSGDKLLFKIYGAGSEQFIGRAKEIENMKLLSDHGLGAGVLFEYSNGFCYHYINGSSITTAEVIKPEIYPLIAAQMAKMHQIPVTSKENVLWSRMESFISLVPEFDGSYVDGLFDSKQDLWTELAFLKTLLQDCDCPVVFCHNDLNLPNIIHDGDDVHFIDVEYAGSNFSAFDIANHFVEYVGFEDPKLDYIKWFPTKEFQLSWLQQYFAALGVENTDQQLDKMYLLVQSTLFPSNVGLLVSGPSSGFKN